MTARAFSAALFLACGLCAQQGAIIKSESRVVLVDAIVTGRNGVYVRDLTMKDFRVWEDNKEQKLNSASLDASATTRESRPLVLFFDQTSMEPADQAAARRAASSFIDAQAGPTRRIAVMVYDGGLRVAQNFTDNAGRLKDALPRPSFTVAAANKRPRDSDVDSATADAGARNMIRSLGDLGKSLGVLPGRKAVVLFDGKLQSNAAQRADVREMMDTFNKSGVALYPVDVRPVSAQTELAGAAYSLPGDRQRSRAATPQGDPDSSTTSAVPDTGAAAQQILFQMASGTGGFVVTNSSDLIRELQKIAEEQDEYYVLSYTPPDSKEGTCHTLKVKVDRGGTTVRARSGYCTSKPVDLLAGTSAERDLEKRAAVSQPGNISASMSLPWFYAAPNVARVHAVLEVSPAELKFAKRGSKLHADLNVLGVAVTSDGAVQARFSDTLGFDFDSEAQIAEWRMRPVHYEKEFRIAPGQYNFTVTFGAGDAFGKSTAPLDIAEWSGHEPAISAIALSRETHPAADLGLSLIAEGHTALTFDDEQIIPTGTNRFRRTDTALFYFEAYGFDPASLRVRVRIVGPNGDTVTDSGPVRLPPAGAGRLAIPGASKLPLAQLSEGVWRLEITATDQSARELRRTADFELR